jgi:hypothetical protein
MDRNVSGNSIVQSALNFFVKPVLIFFLDFFCQVSELCYNFKGLVTSF